MRQPKGHWTERNGVRQNVTRRRQRGDSWARIARIAWWPAATAGSALVALGSTYAFAQVQCDELSRRLGMCSLSAVGSPNPDPKSQMGRPSDAPVLTRMTLPAGQARLIKDGASSVGQPPQGAQLAFQLRSVPHCGTAVATPGGIVLRAPEECAGETVTFHYHVSWSGEAGGPTSRLEIQALIQPGQSSCGVDTSPLAFISIPAGRYSVSDAPSRIADLVRLIGKREVTIAAFCIAEEVVSASEMLAFAADRAEESTQSAARPPVAQPAAGTLNAPAGGISYDLAVAFAENLGRRLVRPVALPTIEHYAAAAIHLLRTQPQSTSTQAFLRSLRGGAIEWLATRCQDAQDTQLALGTRQQSGELDQFCYARTQQLLRMGFRVIASPKRR